MGKITGKNGRMMATSNQKKAPSESSFAGLYIDQSICTFCAGCSSVCPVMAIQVRDSSSEISGGCIDCGNCVTFCPVSAIKGGSGAGQ